MKDSICYSMYIKEKVPAIKDSYLRRIVFMLRRRIIYMYFNRKMYTYRFGKRLFIRLRHNGKNKFHLLCLDNFLRGIFSAFSNGGV